MRILITGGSGLIGSTLTESLAADGHEVIIVSRNPQGIKNISKGVTAVGWEKESLAANLENADAVINLAGASIAGETPLNMRWTAKRKKQILESRVESGNKLAEALKVVKNKPNVFIQSSAIGYYGPQDDRVVDETFPNGSDFLADVCSQWEASSKGVEALGIRRVIVRIGLVFSPRGGVFPILKLPFALFVGGNLGSGKQFLSWIHIEDIVRSIRFLIDDQRSQGVYNLSAPDPLNNTDFTKKLARAMKRPALLPVPAIAMKLLLGEASTLVLDGQRVMPGRLLQAGYDFKYKDLQPALKALLQPKLEFRHAFKVIAPLAKVSEFHRHTQVLKKLTPFPIIVQFKQVEAVGEGTSTDFVLWFGFIPVKWRAAHHDVMPDGGFTDTQVEGPFKEWVHKHTFLEIDAQTTVVIDEIKAHFGKGIFHGLVSRFMWVTLPILFSYRAWKTNQEIAAR